MNETVMCRAAVFRDANEPMSIKEFAVRSLSAGEALVQVECCTLCGSDLHSISGHRSTPVPTILGHEIVGRIAEVATVQPPVDVAGRALNVGDRVVWSVAAACGTCDHCQREMPQKCRQLFKYGHEAITATHVLTGGLADHCLLVPGTTVVRVGDTIGSTEIAPASCATATICEAVSGCRELRGRDVLIFGAGMLGLTATAMSIHAGAANVTVCDVDPDRLARARLFGATAAIEWSTLSTSTLEADVVFEVSGANAAVEAAVSHAAVGGEVILIGSVSPVGQVAIDPEQVVRRLLHIRGVHNYTPDSLAGAVKFLSEARERFPFASLVEQSFPLSRTNEAVAFAQESRACRIAVHPD